jgi:hydroxymethylglutaryl-CoA reductase (NADPH)
MATPQNRFERLESLFAGLRKEQAMLPPVVLNDHSSPRLRHAAPLNRSILSHNWSVLKTCTCLDEADQQRLADVVTLDYIEAYSKNIENCVGTVKLPVGVAGPLRIHGLFAKGDFYIPLATTEAALVASYHRGARLITTAGGCTALVHDTGVTRSPGFVFHDLPEAYSFVQWATKHFNDFRDQASKTTRHGELVDMRVSFEGNHVYINLDFHTGDAAGQNMVTIATAAVVKWIRENSPLKPIQIFVEANFSGDKKATWLSFLTVRGKKVTVEVSLPEALVRKYLHASPQEMVQIWMMATMGGVMSGAMGVQGHCANGIAALYLATGQDAACVSESSVGVTRMELDKDGNLYVALTMPNIIVGTVGGGTKLPSQTVGLKMLQLSGEGQSFGLAEVCASVCLAGELSLFGAMAADHFAAAHERLAR